MTTSFHCIRCHRTGRYPSWVTARYSENTVHRCDYCGTTYCVRYGMVPEVITPPLATIDNPSRVVSPWVDPKYRPYITGDFECEFRDGLRLVLTWNGRHWTWRGLRVDMTDHLKWRGKWLTTGTNDS